MLEARLLARESAGSSIAAKMAMIAMTTSNSIKVNPDFIIAIVFIADVISCYSWQLLLTVALPSP